MYFRRRETGFSRHLNFKTAWFGAGAVAWFVPAFFLLTTTGCYTREVVKAFDGKYASQQNNKIIGEYCQSCHIHRDFDPTAHMEAAKKQYKSKVFQSANECRVCHYIETQFARNELTRKTRWPQEVAKGKFRDFEREQLKENNKK